MLSRIDLNQAVSKSSYKEEMKFLSEKLVETVQKTKELNIPVLIVLDGWSAAGKGTLITNILYPLDPRDFNVHTMGKVNEDIVMRPYLWRYWINTPSQGRLAIFDKSWHRLIFDDKVKLSNIEQENFYLDVMSFERQLAVDGTVIIKLFLHMSKEEQASRFKMLLSKGSTKWRVDQKGLDQHKDYNNQIHLFENMIQNTSWGFSPWHIIEANDSRYATIKSFKILLNALNAAIAKKEKSVANVTVTESHESIVKILKGVNVNKTIENHEYKKKLGKLQHKMSDLGYSLYSERRSVVIVYEGWDAAGKGGNIKRLTQYLDPRAYVVEPIAAPTAEELSHNYLWRFWTRMPKDGHIKIFDRSWYGRVMVERIEGFCTVDEYKRAYAEINNLERQITNHGTVILKFWLHIDRDEQLKRFTDRENNPLKKYKITDEDWRNREKWDLYEDAVDEMLFRTSTVHAPWHIIESNCKKFARIKALEIATSTIENALKSK